jgi:hypothetical protein
MQKKCILFLFPDKAQKEDYVELKLLEALNLRAEDIFEWRVVKRSIDARKKRPRVRLEIEAFVGIKPPKEEPLRPLIKHAGKKAVHIIGAGPAGYFAALKLLEHGIKPIILERGKDVRSRRKDLRAIQQFSIVNAHSNYCYGEGGAGTYSDGKLYTRAKKRGDIFNILKLLVEYGAPQDILVDAHPHIGSNRLPKIIEAIRDEIITKGGEIRFESWVNDIIISKGRVASLKVNDDEEIDIANLILATGHSARDIYEMLHSKDILIESKPFAIGVRLEHPQGLIDQIQYRQSEREEGLPAARYSLSCQINGFGVFSFCMCPGGFIVPAATSPGELVVNGMSLSKRDSPYANSGVVVGVEDSVVKDYLKHGALSGMKFQSDLEKKIFENNEEGSQKAPAQRLTDFLNSKISTDLPDTSYIPGIYSARLDDLLPEHIVLNLKKGLRLFGNKMKGYISSEAKLVGLESRTSSPVRIPRNKETLEHPEVSGLYPCGEGAGYAGGIMSAAMDGQRVALIIAQKLALS